MELKDYQQGVLTKFDSYLSTLRGQVRRLQLRRRFGKLRGIAWIWVIPA